MDLKVLRYFLALAKEGSVTAAANYLHITQPTLSRQLSELEEILGVTLFIRGSRRITLTDEGILLRKRAEEILALAQKTKNEFLIPKETIKGDVYIGGGESYVIGLIAEIIKDIQEQYPEIRFHIYSGDAEDVTEKLDSGLLDFGVLIHPTDITKYEALTLPNKDRWGVLMRKDSSLASLKSINPSDLWNLPLITSRQKKVDNNISKWMQRDYNDLNIVATYNLIFNASLLVEKGVGYALGLDKLINISQESPLCFKPFNPPLEVEIDVVWKRYQIFSKASELFLTALKKRYPSL